MNNAWMFALLLSSIVGGGAIFGAVAMDMGESPEFMTQDTSTEEVSPLGDGECNMEGEQYQYRYMQGEKPQEQTRERNREQNQDCCDDPIQQQDRLRDRQQNRTHDGECEKHEYKHENGDQDGEKYQNREQNFDEDAKYKYQHKENKRTGCMP